MRPIRWLALFCGTKSPSSLSFLTLFGWPAHSLLAPVLCAAWAWQALFALVSRVGGTSHIIYPKKFSVFSYFSYFSLFIWSFSSTYFICFTCFTCITYLTRTPFPFPPPFSSPWIRKVFLQLVFSFVYKSNTYVERNIEEWIYIILIKGIK